VPHRGLVLAAATVGFGVIQLDVSVVNVAVKPIGAALGGGVTGLQWVVDAYTLTFAALILSAGARPRFITLPINWLVSCPARLSQVTEAVCGRGVRRSLCRSR
jgi:hypothetical protein